MNNSESLIDHINVAFGENEYPGDDYLQGSFEGSEPFEEIEPFRAFHDWRTVPKETLDRHYSALNFFSEAGLRFFLPAYLIADLRGELATADPLFVLVHGFSDLTVEHRIGDQVYIRNIGKSAFVNPRRYGGMRFYDYARYRLSIFTREEAEAIVAYLIYREEVDEGGVYSSEIKSALNSFWLERVNTAASTQKVLQYLSDEDRYQSALLNETGRGE